MLICPHCHRRAGRDHHCHPISRRHFFFGLLSGLSIVVSPDGFLHQEIVLGDLNSGNIYVELPPWSGDEAKKIEAAVVHGLWVPVKINPFLPPEPLLRSDGKPSSIYISRIDPRGTKMIVTHALGPAAIQLHPSSRAMRRPDLDALLKAGLLFPLSETVPKPSPPLSS